MNVKRALGIAALVAVLMVCAVLVHGQAAKNRALPQNDEKALEASDMLAKAWMGPDGVDYPDYYGGCCIKEGRCTVYLTDMEKASDVRSLLKDSAKYVDFVSVKYSLNELIDLARDCGDMLKAEGIGVTMTGTIEAENRVEIAVLPEDHSRALELIASYGDVPITVSIGSEWVDK